MMRADSLRNRLQGMPSKLAALVQLQAAIKAEKAKSKRLSSDVASSANDTTAIQAMRTAYNEATLDVASRMRSFLQSLERRKACALELLQTNRSFLPTGNDSTDLKSVAAFLMATDVGAPAVERNGNTLVSLYELGAVFDALFQGVSLFDGEILYPSVVCSDTGAV